MSRRLLNIFGAIFLLTSCTQYQYVHLSSDLPKTSDSEHYYLTDSLVYVDFDFNGNGLPVKIYFLNESEEAVYFDLTETLFFENQSLVENAYRLTGGDLDERIFIPPGKGAAFQFRPFQSRYLALAKAQSNYVEISSESRKQSELGIEMQEIGRTFEVLITYRTGTEGENKVSLSAKFREDFIYFTTREPEFFPGGKSPYCYYISEGSEGGQLATSLLLEVASASLYYLMLESLD